MERSWRPTWTNRPATSLDRARPSHVVHGVGMTSCVRVCGYGNLIARIREVLRAFPMLCRPLACGGVLSHLCVSFGSAFVWRARACPCARTQLVGKRTRREAALAWCPRASVVMRRPFCPRVIALLLFLFTKASLTGFRLGRLGRVAIALRIFWRIVAQFILFARVGSGEGFHVAASLPCSRRKSFPGL